MNDEALFTWLRTHPGLPGLCMVAFITSIEYVFPPAPGDGMTLFAFVLALRTGTAPISAFGASMVGAIGGSLGAYGIGRFFGGSRRPRWLRGPRIDGALGELERRFAKHGAAYLIVNRFVPFFRGFFFFAAGAGRMPIERVVLYGAISSALWNALLLALAIAGQEVWHDLQTRFSRATILGGTAAFLVLVVMVARWWVKKRRAGPQ